jgi:hypothetical protein
MGSDGIARARNSALLAVAVLYVLGAVVTAVHLGRLGIREVSAVKVNYLFCGAVCAVYLALRISIALGLAEVHRVAAVLRDAADEVLSSLRSRLPERLQGGLPALWWKRRGASMLSAQTTMLMGALVMYLAIPLVAVLTRVVDLRDTGVEFRWLGVPVMATVFLLLYQGFMVLVFFLRRPLQRTRPMRCFWQLLLAMVLLADVANYALFVHPIIRPAFGGGRATAVRLLLKEADLAAAFGDIGAAVQPGLKAYLLYETGDALYVTPTHRVNYSSERISGALEHGAITRIPKDALLAVTIAERGAEHEGLHGLRRSARATSWAGSCARLSALSAADTCKGST